MEIIGKRNAYGYYETTLCINRVQLKEMLANSDCSEAWCASVQFNGNHLTRSVNRTLVHEIKKFILVPMM